jgi:hypothetical protein
MNIYQFPVVVGAIFLQEFLFFDFGGIFHDVVDVAVAMSFCSEWVVQVIVV